MQNGSYRSHTLNASSDQTTGFYIITNNIVQHLMSGLLVTFNVNKQFEEIIAKISSKQLQRGLMERSEKGWDRIMIKFGVELSLN